MFFNKDDNKRWQNYKSCKRRPLKLSDAAPPSGLQHDVHRRDGGGLGQARIALRDALGEDVGAGEADVRPSAARDYAVAGPILNQLVAIGFAVRAGLKVAARGEAD